MKAKQTITIIHVAIRQLLSSAFNLALPFVVIYFTTKQVWGEFVSILLFILLASSCTNFGNKEYLLRQFSSQPQNIRRHFTTNFYARTTVLILSFIIVLFVFSLPFSGFICLSLLGLYISQSFEAVIVFEKKFLFSSLTESAFGLLMLMALLFFRNNISALLILQLYAFLQLLKATIYTFFFFEVFEKKAMLFDFNILRKSFPFFLLTLMGLLASKNDVYLVGYFLDKSSLAEYQIINNLCLFVMGTAGFFYTPFTKNIYRNKEIVIQQLKKTLIVLGFVLTILAVVTLSFVIRFYLKIPMPFYFYGAAFSYIYPSFIYGIEIITLYKNHKEMKVVIFLFVGIIINMLLSALLLHYGFGISGVLLGSAVAQWLVLGMFVFQKNHNQNCWLFFKPMQ